MFLLCATAPINALSIEKAGQFGDSFGIVTSLFSGCAFFGVLITLHLQQVEIKRSERSHEQNKRLTSLAALIGIYTELADKKQAEVDIYHGTSQIGEKLSRELKSIYKKRDYIYSELEKAINIEITLSPNNME
jgi:hypothetical protein